jgi:hypothetical protein
MTHVRLLPLSFFRPQEKGYNVIYVFFCRVHMTVNLFVVVSEPVNRTILDHPPSTNLPVRFRRCPSLYRSHPHVSTKLQYQ